MAIPTGVACACGRARAASDENHHRAGAVESLPILAGELAEGVLLALSIPLRIDWRVKT